MVYIFGTLLELSETELCCSLNVNKSSYYHLLKSRGVRLKEST